MTIQTVEQFDSVLNIFKLLDKLSIGRKAVDTAAKEFLEQEGDEWTVKECCGKLPDDCYCHYDDDYYHDDDWDRDEEDLTDDKTPPSSK